MRKTLFTRLLFAASLCFAIAANAQDYPSKPIRVVVPFPPGALTDALARLVAEKLQGRWGQPVIVENRAGAGGNIGAEVVFKAEADGYTLLFAPPAPLVLNKLLYTKLAYDPDGFAPISMLVSGPVVLVAQPGLAATSLAQLIAYAKANPGKINYASGGSGNTTHLTAELFNSMAGINTVHVPYQGIAPAVTALLGGQSDIMFVDLGAVNAHLRSGKLRALAVGADKRHSLLPGVPAMAEVLPGFMSMGWLGMAAPPATPAPIVGRLSTAIAEVLKLPDVAKRVADMNFDVVGSTPAEMQQFMRGERERWGQVIRTIGVKVE